MAHIKQHVIHIGAWTIIPRNYSLDSDSLPFNGLSRNKSSEGKVCNTMHIAHTRFVLEKQHSHVATIITAILWRGDYWDPDNVVWLWLSKWLKVDSEFNVHTEYCASLLGQKSHRRPPHKIAQSFWKTQRVLTIMMISRFDRGKHGWWFWRTSTVRLYSKSTMWFWKAIWSRWAWLMQCIPVLYSEWRWHWRGAWLQPRGHSASTKAVVEIHHQLIIIGNVCEWHSLQCGLELPMHAHLIHGHAGEFGHVSFEHNPWRPTTPWLQFHVPAGHLYSDREMVRYFDAYQLQRFWVSSSET